MPSQEAIHQPVLVQEVLNHLQIQPGQWYIDTTFGRGGHTQLILDKQGLVIAFDVDRAAINYAQDHFAQEIEADQLLLVHANFSHLKDNVTRLKKEHSHLAAISGVLFDFGTSQDQIKASHRGFSFDQPLAPLDMRMDDRLGVTAADLLTFFSVKQLTQLFKEYGGEKQGKKIAQAIDHYRGKDREQKIETVGQLVEIIEQVKTRHSHLHPATKVFQALRIAVNDELGSIQAALPQALSILEAKGRLIAISFHEGEDRIVKHQFRDWQKQKKGRVITDHPITASDSEINNNPSARSAKLRAFLKH